MKAPVSSVKTDSSDKLKIKDDIDLCICKVESILMNFPIHDLSSVEDIKSKVCRVAETIATYNYLISKLSSDEESHPKSLDKVVR